jgi:hypothetical protein
MRRRLISPLIAISLWSRAPRAQWGPGGDICIDDEVVLHGVELLECEDVTIAGGIR